MRARTAAKTALGLLRHVDRAPAEGATILIYHRVGGGSRDELDLPVPAFAAQLDALVDSDHDVLSLDAALDRLDAGDRRPAVVLTFDDGFADVHDVALPLLRERRLPFTLYLAAGLVGGTMAWEGSAASSQGSPALTWAQLEALSGSGLCTIGNHTWDHATPAAVDVGQLDRCSDAIDARLGARPRHFAWTWGVPVPSLLPAVRDRFRSAATGEVGRNGPGGDRHALRRVPVRATDPPSFFAAKLRGGLWGERAYGAVVELARGRRRGDS
ncbi:MAG: polysaccharide deacetylase family protein [Acidimicrobiales bacterium]